MFSKNTTFMNKLEDSIQLVFNDFSDGVVSLIDPKLVDLSYYVRELDQYIKMMF